MENKSNLTFSFCGDYEVNALSLSNAITSLVEISSTIAEREFPDIEFRMSVKAVAPGSLNFDFVAAAIVAAQTLFSPSCTEYAANLISVVSAVFSIKKFLKGRPPQNTEKVDEKIIITNSEGLKIEAPKSAGVYFIDNRIDKSITNIISSARISEGVTGIAVNANGLVEISRDEFEACSEEIKIEDTRGSLTKVREREILFIRQADFSGDLKWKFKWDQNITAAVLDSDFLKRVKSGEIGINAKTYIIADVEVKIYLGLDEIPDDSKPTYNIKKVHSVCTVGEEQTKIEI